MSNYPLVSKSADLELEVVDVFPEDVEKTSSMLRGIDKQDERYVLGVVLEPETVDSQGDIYSAAEVRKAAHRFMEEFGDLGLQHRESAAEKVRIMESYLAPEDLTLGERTVKSGTWLFAVRIQDDELWSQVQRGQYSGFSIGGSAVRNPDYGHTVTAKSDSDDEDQPPETKPAQRLRDIIVREVSLVDRAANRRRFLIIKRGESVSEIEAAPAASEETAVPAESDSSHTTDLVDAITAVTEAINSIGPTPDESVSHAIGQLAAQIQAATPEEERAEPEENKTTNKPEPEAAPEPDPRVAVLETSMGQIQQTLTQIQQALAGNHTRLSQVEKRFGVPNSTPEQPTRPRAAEASWPMDLNRPLDRESVDKSVSFHQL